MTTCSTGNAVSLVLHCDCRAPGLFVPKGHSQSPYIRGGASGLVLEGGRRGEVEDTSPT